jgi:hypothetical protein
MGPVARTYLFTLLAIQFQEGSIPSDREILKMLLLMPQDPGGSFDQEAVLEQVLQCFEPDGTGRLKNPRMDEIRGNQLDLAKAKSMGGRAGRNKQLQALPGESPG